MTQEICETERVLALFQLGSKSLIDKFYILWVLPSSALNSLVGEPHYFAAYKLEK